jgi:hypothetical protein
VHPLELLALDRVAGLVERVGKRQPSLALVLALCRLLVPCLRYRGSDRHLIVEAWSEVDLRGESLSIDVRTPLARELAAEQAEDWHLVRTGEQPPAGTLAELFWAAHTPLPHLPAVFEDVELGQLAKALYFQLVPEGQGRAELQTSGIKAAVEAVRADDFAPLELAIPPRRLHRLFRRLLAVTIRYAGQLTGAAARQLIEERLGSGHEPLRPAELALLELRYGASPALGDINVGFLFGCGPLLADLIDEYALALAAGGDESRATAAAGRLSAFIGLLARFRQRRRHARAAERREDRQRHADRMPRGSRMSVENAPDASSPDPVRTAEVAEELELLRELLPSLKPRDRARLEMLLACDGDRKVAADRLGISLGTYSRQLRQTVFPAVRRAFGGRQTQGPDRE